MMTRRKALKDFAYIATVGLFLPRGYAQDVLPVRRRIAAAAAAGSTVLYDNSNINEVSSNNVLTTSATVGSGSNRLLLALITFGDSGGANSVVTCLYGAAAFTGAISGFGSYDGNFCGILGQYLLAPATGTANVVVTVTNNTLFLGCIVMSFSNVHQTTPFGTAATATSTANKNPSVTVSGASGDMIVNACSTDCSAITVSGSNTSRQEIDDYGSDVCFGGSTAAGAASVVMSWTGSGGDNGWASSGIAVKPA